MLGVAQDRGETEKENKLNKKGREWRKERG